jgi:hypothetical protein
VANLPLGKHTLLGEALLFINNILILYWKLISKIEIMFQKVFKDFVHEIQKNVLKWIKYNLPLLFINNILISC